MTIQLCSILAAASMLSVAGLAQATTAGLNLDPGGSAWDRGDANTGYAQLDSFPTFAFSNVAPVASFNVSTPVFGQASASGNPMFGAGLYNVLQSTPVASNGDVLFQGASTLSFTLTGSTTFAIKGLTLQMKRPGNVGGLVGNFAPTISVNGDTPIAFNSTSTISGSGDTSADAPGNYSVTTWTWDASLASNVASGTFTINIPSVGNITRGIDFIAADFASVAPVPEPSAYALGIGALLVGVCIMRRRRVQASR